MCDTDEDDLFMRAEHCWKSRGTCRMDSEDKCVARGDSEQEERVYDRFDHLAAKCDLLTRVPVGAQINATKVRKEGADYVLQGFAPRDIKRASVSTDARHGVQLVGKRGMVASGLSKPYSVAPVDFRDNPSTELIDRALGDASDPHSARAATGASSDELKRTGGQLMELEREEFRIEEAVCTRCDHPLAGRTTVPEDMCPDVRGKFRCDGGKLYRVQESVGVYVPNELCDRFEGRKAGSQARMPELVSRASLGDEAWAALPPNRKGGTGGRLLQTKVGGDEVSWGGAGGQALKTDCLLLTEREAEPLDKPLTADDCSDLRFAGKHRGTPMPCLNWQVRMSESGAPDASCRLPLITRDDVGADTTVRRRGDSAVVTKLDETFEVPGGEGLADGQEYTVEAVRDATVELKGSDGVTAVVPNWQDGGRSRAGRQLVQQRVHGQCYGAHGALADTLLPEDCKLKGAWGLAPDDGCMQTVLVPVSGQGSTSAVALDLARPTQDEDGNSVNCEAFDPRSVCASGKWLNASRCECVGGEYKVPVLQAPSCSKVTAKQPQQVPEPYAAREGELCTRNGRTVHCSGSQRLLDLASAPVPAETALAIQPDDFQRLYQAKMVEGKNADYANKAARGSSQTMELDDSVTWYAGVCRDDKPFHERDTHAFCVPKDEAKRGLCKGAEECHGKEEGGCKGKCEWVPKDELRQRAKVHPCRPKSKESASATCSKHRHRHTCASEPECEWGPFEDGCRQMFGEQAMLQEARCTKKPLRAGGSRPHCMRRDTQDQTGDFGSTECAHHNLHLGRDRADDGHSDLPARADGKLLRIGDHVRFDADGKMRHEAFPGYDLSGARERLGLQAADVAGKSFTYDGRLVPRNGGAALDNAPIRDGLDMTAWSKDACTADERCVWGVCTSPRPLGCAQHTTQSACEPELRQRRVFQLFDPSTWCSWLGGACDEQTHNPCKWVEELATSPRLTQESLEADSDVPGLSTHASVRPVTGRCVSRCGMVPTTQRRCAVTGEAVQEAVHSCGRWNPDGRVGKLDFNKQFVTDPDVLDPKERCSFVDMSGERAQGIDLRITEIPSEEPEPEAAPQAEPQQEEEEEVDLSGVGNEELLEEVRERGLV